MKKIKNIICGIFAICLIMSFVTAYAADKTLAIQNSLEPVIRMLSVRNNSNSNVIASGKCGDNLIWTLDSEGTLTISGTGDMYDYGFSNMFPWKKYSDSLTKLVLEEGMTGIGDMAFYGCHGFSGDLIIPDSVTSIGNYAFTSCSGLTGNCIIPDSVTNIGEAAFSSCSGFDGNLIISDSVTSIGYNAFSSCSGLTGNLIIPDSVTSIDDMAFHGCHGFSGDLIIPDSVTSIGDDAFSSCSGLTGSLIIPDSVTSIGYNAFRDCSSFDGNLIISDIVTSIGNYAFTSCSGLTGNCIIPDSVTNIGEAAFYGCNNITDMYIPRTEDSIKTGDFPNRVHWKYDLSKCTATIKNYTYTGETIVPDKNNITVTSPNGKTLYYGTDYIIESAKNNISAGTATAHIAPLKDGISLNNLQATFNILPKSAERLRITNIPNQTFTGLSIKPPVTVTDTERSY